ncbi:MAG: DUF2975 domain-containing protein [Oscillospiraceae bacterium]|nr:DUF2975 domain-containing protein [Oscillospiraceae bacterium]
MKKIGKISRFLEITMIALMVISGIMTVTLPWSIPFITGRDAGEPENYYWKYLIVLTYSGIIAEFILWHTRGIIHNVVTRNPFCHDTVRRLRVVGSGCLLISVSYAFAVFFVSKVFMVVVLAAFMVMGLFLLVFSELFRQAVAYKEENDMTI